MPTVSLRAGFVPVTAALTVAATMLLSGCGGGDSGSAAKTTTAAASSASAAPGAPKPATITVDVADMKFSPADLTVKVGDTVTWKFHDRFPHSVQGIGDKAMGINSPIFDKGEWSYTFTAPGTYRYMCSLHPEMRGTVTAQ
ncbi:cupredoxin domain-containing protein [Nocardia arthritidis]|uniref:Copper-binding protein n=1 Tax=Nocardia arthritidis TaxID=228602 RepID=A0A6G9Y7G6_9NOCA|nr:cupredoxin family copper-binding protein [Nocardia arthritidis]QIS09084.1 copper-binding protein [Nocardia arthritidis]